MWTAGAPGAQMARPPSNAAAALSRCPSMAAARSSTASSSHGAWWSAVATRTPASAAAALDPMPRPIGIRFTHAKCTPVAGTPSSAHDFAYATVTRLCAGSCSAAGASRPASTLIGPGRCSARMSFCSWRASARMSNPGPRLATLAGTATRTRTRSDLDGARQGARVRGDLGDRRQRRLNCARVLQTVAGEHADRMGPRATAPSAMARSRTASAAADAGSQKMPSRLARRRWASRIAASSTDAIIPSD